MSAVATIDEIYGGAKYGQHPIDDEIKPATWKRAVEYGLLRSLAGQKVVLTGTMSMPRKDLAAMIDALGGLYCNAVPAGGAYVLVHADGARFGKKMQAAADAGMQVMSEEKFVRYLVPSADELDEDREPVPFGWRIKGWTHTHGKVSNPW